MNTKTTQAQAFAERMFNAGIACAELMTSYIGVRLALYDVLAEWGPLTATALASKARIASRYAREWLEQQAAAGILEVNDITSPPEARLYLLPEGHREALTDPNSPWSVAPLALLSAGMREALPQLLEAYRYGSGVPFEVYGSDFRCGQSGLNRPVFRHLLPGWIRGVLPSIHTRLLDGLRIADIGCGAGWSSIALAHRYERVHVHGIDLDLSSIELARQNADAAGLSSRVQFTATDVLDLPALGNYGLVCIFDALHDMAHPVEVLAVCRGLIEKGGAVLLMEPNAAEAFNAPASDTERFFYAISVLHCLPVGMSQSPSAGTGTVMRPDTVKAYAREAGFARVTTHPVDH